MSLAMHVFVFIEAVVIELLGCRDWLLPSRRPDGTAMYKNRALRTPFVKVSHALRIFVLQRTSMLIC